MQITLDKEFNTCIDAANSIIKENTTLPILRCLKIKSEQNLLKIYATDLEFSIDCDCPYNALIPEDFNTVVPGNKFKNIITAIGAGTDIELNPTDKYLQINSADAGEYQLITGFKVEDYPYSEIKDIQFEFTLNAQELRNALNAVEFCSSQSDFRAALNSVYFDFIDYELRLVSTNGHKLGVYYLKCFEDTNLNGKSLLLPIKFIPILKKHLPVGQVKVQVAENEVIFQSVNIRIGTRLVSNTFPDYTRVIPDSSLSHNYELNTASITAALRRLNAVIDDKKKTSSVKFQFQDNKLILTTEKNEGNSGKEVIQLDDGCIDGVTALNIDYILKTVSKITEPTFTFKFEDTATAVRIDTIIDGYPVIYIIMPVRL